MVMAVALMQVGWSIARSGVMLVVVALMQVGTSRGVECDGNNYTHSKVNVATYDRHVQEMTKHAKVNLNHEQ